MLSSLSEAKLNPLSLVLLQREIVPGRNPEMQEDTKSNEQGVNRNEFYQATQVAKRFSTTSAQGVILETRDQVGHQAPCMEPASPSACVSASRSCSVCHE